MRLLVTADWHVRGDRPRCRTDEDWIEVQRQCIREIFDLALLECAEVRIVGDIFHTPRVATEALCMVIEEFTRFTSAGGKVKILAGNHDLPYHSYALVAQCSFGVLRAMVPEIVESRSVDAAPFGLDNPTGKELAYTHRLVFPDKGSIPPGCEASVASEVLAAFPSRLVFTGDYHHAFHEKAPDLWAGLPRFLVNPGCINRQAVDMADYNPKVALVETGDEHAESPIRWVILDTDRQLEGAVSRDHITIQEERDARIEAFVELLKTNQGISLSFMDNLEDRLKFATPGVQAVTREVIQRSKEQNQ